MEILKETFLYFLPIEKYIRTFDKKYKRSFPFFHPLSYVLAAVLNPYHLDWIVMGITDCSRCTLSGEILRRYGYSGTVVCGHIEGLGYIDEISVFGYSKICYFDESGVYVKTIHPKEIFSKEIKLSEYIFQSKSQSVEKRKFEEILKGTAPLEAKAFVAANAAIGAHLITGEPLVDAAKKCLEVIDSGEPYLTWIKFRDLAGS